MLKYIVHWLIFIAVVIQLVSCIFFGQEITLPDQPF